MPNTPLIKPRVGISQCLLGDPVRYDGGHKRQPLLVELLGPRLQWLDFCPEVAAGLGVPRPPVRLVASDRGLRAQGVEVAGLDVTETLQAATAAFWQRPAAQALVGFVLKSRSPSCGLGSTPVYDTAGHEQSQGDGFFAQGIKQQVTQRVVVEESWLNSESRCYQFLTACWLVANLRQQSQLPAGLAEVLQQVLPDYWQHRHSSPDELIAALLAPQASSGLMPLKHYWRQAAD